MTAEERLMKACEARTAAQWGEPIPAADIAREALALLRRLGNWECGIDHEWSCQATHGQQKDGTWLPCTCGLTQLHNDLNKFLDGEGGEGDV